MLEDIAKITEARGIQPGSPKVDVIVWVAKDVPHSVYLDETYAFRILMNVSAQPGLNKPPLTVPS